MFAECVKVSQSMVKLPKICTPPRTNHLSAVGLSPYDLLPTSWCLVFVIFQLFLKCLSKKDSFGNIISSGFQFLSLSCGTPQWPTEHTEALIPKKPICG